MNTEELKRHINIQRVSCGFYKVTIEYRKKFYSCYSVNTLAYDRVTGYAYVVPDRAVKDFYTYKGALREFWNECKRTNGL